MRQCRLHKTALKHGKREIRRGLPPPPPDGYFSARETLFPNAKSYEIGGCLIGPDDKDESRVYFCPDCRKVEADWHAGRESEDFWLP